MLAQSAMVVVIMLNEKISSGTKVTAGLILRLYELWKRP